MKKFCLLLLLMAGWTGNLLAQAPAIASLSPTTISAGSGDFQLTVNGSNFQPPRCLVTWNNLPIATNCASASQATGTVPGSYITMGNETAYVSILNPDGGTATPVPFLITPSLTITTSSLPQGTVGLNYSALLTATGGTLPLTWAALNAFPPGLALNSNGVISGVPTTAGNYSVTVQVTDAGGLQGTKSYQLSIVPPPIPPLNITTAPQLAAGQAGTPYSTTLTATGGTPPYRWSAVQGVPAWMTVGATTGTLSGTPTTAGTVTFTVQVADAGSLTATKGFSLTITAPALTIATLPPLFNGTVGVPYSQQFVASGGVPPVTWSIISGSAGNLTLDANSGILSGTPQTAGNFTFTVQAADSAGQLATQAYPLTINPPAITITAPSTSFTGAVGAFFSQAFAATGGTPPYTWAINTPIPGLSLDPNQGVLSGTPTAPGTFPFTLQATDKNNVSGTRSFTLTVTPAALKITTPNQLPDTALGAPFSYQMTATGGVPPYNWLANGLPSGVSINANTGLLSGTVGSAGPIQFTVTVRDSNSPIGTYTDLFRINVVPPPLPNITISGLPGTANPLAQYTLTISLDSAYPVDVNGTAILTSAPGDNGPSDGTIQFATGGKSAPFTIPAGSTSSPTPLAVQVGSVAGTITVTLSGLTVGGFDVTPVPAPSANTQIARAAPVIAGSSVSRSGSTLTVQVTGYVTSREITQAVFTFTAASGQTLSTSQFTIPVDAQFAAYFQNAQNAAFGSQFVLSVPFTIQGDINSVIPQNVTLTNRVGSTTAAVGH